MNFTIAPVNPTEVVGLLQLIRELAVFEKLEHEMESTVESLQLALFGPQPAAGALLARCDGELAGYAIYFFTFSSFVGRAGIWLEDLYVRPAYRRQGFGGSLIRAVAGVGAERNCGRFEWTALDWNRNAVDYYRRLGARSLDQWILFRLNEAGLQKLAKPN